jgi:hypothetical protein
LASAAALLHLLTTGYGTKRRFAGVQQIGRNGCKADMAKASTRSMSK